ncbi:MAG: bacterial Ig-like domain-containing protein, partial [Anaerovoracaceae bacterium]
MSTEYPKDLFEDANGNPFSGPGSLGISLIASKPSESEAGKFETALEGEGIKGLDYLTFDLSISCNAIRAGIKKGNKLAIALPYPKGYDPRELSGVSFVAYHFKEDPDNPGKYIPEPLVCNATETGIWIMVDSFSPFTIASVNGPVTPPTSDKAVSIDVDSKMGEVTFGSESNDNPQAQLFTLNEGKKQRTATITPKKGYYIEQIELNGKVLEDSKDLAVGKAYNLDLQLDDLETSNKVNVVMKADSVRKEEAKVDLAPVVPKIEFITEEAPTFEPASNKIVGLKMLKNPNKLTYYSDEDIDVTGGKLGVIYEDGQVREMTLLRSMCEVWSLTDIPLGLCAVKVNYDLFEMPNAFEVEFKKNGIVSAELIAPTADQTKYLVGLADQKLNLTGGKWKLTYESGRTEEVLLNDKRVTLSGYDFDKAGQQTVKVKLDGWDKEGSFDITVQDKEVESIAIKDVPSAALDGTKADKYIQDQNFEIFTDGKLTVKYNNGKSEDIAITYDMIAKSFDLSKVGEQSFTVNYGGKTASYKKEVVAKKVESGRVSKVPTTTLYYVGESTALDTTGGELSVSYDNGKTETRGFTEKDCVPGTYNLNKGGLYSVMVNLEPDVAEAAGVALSRSPVPEKTATFMVVVAGTNTLTGPTKTSYLEGEAFDPTGITIDYVTTMGILEPRPWDGKTMEVQGYDSKKLGTQSLNLKFTADGHDYLVQDAFSVTVEKKIDFGIKLASGPKKVSYMQGEAFDPTGITIDFVGEDGKAISLQWDEKTMTIEGFDSSTAGTQKITINYTVDKKTYTAKDAFTVEVKAKDEPNKPVDPKP